MNKFVTAIVMVLAFMVQAIFGQTAFAQGEVGRVYMTFECTETSVHATFFTYEGLRPSDLYIDDGNGNARMSQWHKIWGGYYTVSADVLPTSEEIQQGLPDGFGQEIRVGRSCLVENGWEMGPYHPNSFSLVR